jgi:protein-S-isoprenylcysteine O-methyltransferase Ste14
LHKLFGAGEARPDAAPAGATARVAVLAYGLAAYLAFFGAIVYAIGFVGNWVVPKSIDSGVAGPVWQAVLVNSALLLAFVVQHTIMARPWFKRWWTRMVPVSIERSTYVLAASVCLGAVMFGWRPMAGVVWRVDGAAGWVLDGVALLGWGLVFASSFMVSHWDLFGVRQVVMRALGCTYEPIGFRVVGLYRIVRHPLMLGFLLAVWSTSVMSVGHLFFAGMITGYILFGTTMEERDLMAHFGDLYRDYQRRVPGIIPRPRKTRSGT